MIISGAAIPPGQVNTESDELIHSADLYDTILDLLGIDISGLYPAGLVRDSQSFHPLLTGASSTHTRTFAYSAQPGATADDRNLMVANDDYKWIRSDDGSEEFYYLADGLAEDNNRINNLSLEAQTALSGFQAIAGDLVNIPAVHRSYFENGEFRIELGWFANANLSVLT